MKFITEEELRDRYKRNPFTDYKPEPGTKLTPGARQFLSDLGMLYPKGEHRERSFSVSHKDNNGFAEPKLKLLEAEFLCTAAAITEDVCLAGQVIALSRHLRKEREQLTLEPCTGIKEENLYHCMEDCFSINDQHLQLDKSNIIFSLHRLRCLVRVTTAEMTEKQCTEEKNKLNGIANILSQMICRTIGGTVCQKKG